MDVVFVLDISGYIQRQYQNALMFAMNGCERSGH